MVTYLLDTCVLIELFRGREETIDWLSSIPANEIGLSSVTVMELQAGIEYATIKVEEKKGQLKQVLAVYEVLPFTREDAVATARIMAELKKRGQMIGPYDLQIAGVALSRELTLVSGNLREFQRVEGLEVVACGG